MRALISIAISTALAIFISLRWLTHQMIWIDTGIVSWKANPTQMRDMIVKPCHWRMGSSVMVMWSGSTVDNLL
jgi:hypothetical protein